MEGDDLGLPGKLGMTIAPGVRDDHALVGAWRRDIGSDLDRISNHYGATTLVVLLEEYELKKYGIQDLIPRARDAGLEVIDFPIVDVSVPRKAQSDDYADLIESILAPLHAGETVVVHCRGGIGRTGVVAASVLVVTGHDADEAISKVRQARDDRMLETPEQEEYVRSFARDWRTRNA